MPPLGRRKLQVFISSTYNDLLEDRQAAVSAILKTGHIPAGMELFNAGDQSQLETIKRWIDESDIFMLILGGRYGSIEPESGLGYTEIEYDYAIATGRPFFAVVIESAALEKRTRKMGSKIRELKEPQKLTSFRKKVTSRMCRFFSDISDIKLAVHESIPELERQHSLTGWIHASSVPDTTGLINEISRVNEENRALLEELKRAKHIAASSPARERIHQKELKLTATSLAKNAIEFSDYDLKYSREAERVSKAIASVSSFIRKGFTEFGRIPTLNELSFFYFVAPEMVNGLAGHGQAGYEYELVKRFVAHWTLEDLVSVGASGFHRTVIYRVGIRGKRLFQLLSSRKRALGL